MKNGFINIGLIVALLIVAGIIGYGLVRSEKQDLAVDKLPAWAKSIIEEQKNSNNPADSFSRWEYKGQTVYFLPQRSWDIASNLYDRDGNIICHPDGGFSGKGDERCPDFFTERQGGKVMWEYKLSPRPVACTEEGKRCPDGSYVGRVGPDCEFAQCPPAPAPTGTIVYLREGQREGSLQVLKIYPDRVEGLNFWEYPVARNEGYPITLRVGEVASNGCTVILTLLRIEGSVATFSKKVDENRMCPICLSQGTLIATPNGEVAIEDLKVGDLVFSVDGKGNKISIPIIKVGRTLVPSDHQMARLVSPDGRVLLVSPGHPLPDGRLVGDLSAERVNYSQSYTYDILPFGPTGFYWANGIMLAPTLKF